MNWTIFKGMAALGTALLIAGCGAGGSGGAGGTQAYTITLRADKTSLPLNIAGYGPSIGGSYTTTLYVSAKDATGNAVTSGTFNCNVISNLDAGPLYYLDGDPEHETTETINGVEVTTPNAYRSITLESNAGAATFHFHASDLAETATIRCGIVGKDGVQRTADATVQVGSTPTGKVSQIIFTPFSPNYLFPQNYNNYTQVQGQLWMVDEAGQRIPNPVNGINNLEVNILNNAGTTAEDTATLRGVDADSIAVAGKSIRLGSINGQAQFTLVSGSSTGTITVEAVSDRADNNVDNGITERIANLVTISVVSEAPGSGSGSTPLDVTTTGLPAATYNIPYASILEASGGTPPYSWSLATGSSLIPGLSIATSGIISGTPYGSTSGTFNFVVRVTDAASASTYQNLSIGYTYIPPAGPEESAPTVNTSTLADCQVGSACVRTLSASGGTSPYTWTATSPLPTGMSLNSAGVISGTPTTQGVYTITVTAKGATLTSPPKTITLTVLPNTTSLTILTSTLAAGKVGTPYAVQLNAYGGTPAYTWTSTQLPAGLALNAATGAISGTPTAAATDFTFEVTVTDTAGTPVSVDKVFTITIAP